jgi:hypothetical protein
MRSLNKSKFTSKLLSVLVLTLAFASANQANAASYKLDLLSDISKLGMGDTFEVKVSVDDPFAGVDQNDGLLGFGFNFNYDSSMLSFSSAMAAFGDDLASYESYGWDDLSGNLKDAAVAGTSYPSLPNQAQHNMSLATLTFKITGAGNSQIAIFSHYDSEHLNNGLTYESNSNIDPKAAYLNVNIGVVPEAESYAMLLAGLGVLGFAAWRKMVV